MFVKHGWGWVMGIPRIQAVKPPADLGIAEDDFTAEPSNRIGRTEAQRRSRRGTNAIARLERDRASTHRPFRAQDDNLGNAGCGTAPPQPRTNPFCEDLRIRHGQGL
jgi:hypothetical protein